MKRGLITPQEEEEKGVGAIQAASQEEEDEEEEASVSPWDGVFGKAVYLSGLRALTDVLSRAQIEAIWAADGTGDGGPKEAGVPRPPPTERG